MEILTVSLEKHFSNSLNRISLFPYGAVKRLRIFSIFHCCIPEISSIDNNSFPLKFYVIKLSYHQLLIHLFCQLQPLQR